MSVIRKLSRRQLSVLAACVLVVVIVVVLVPLRVTSGLNTSRQKTLYHQTVELFEQQARYAASHQGGYAPTALDLATGDSAVSFAADASNTPVTQFANNVSTHGYFMKLADQSLGGTVSFSALVPDSGSPVLTCSGPAPLCDNGRFKLPKRVHAFLADAQARLYAETVAVLAEATRVARVHGGIYAPIVGDLASQDPDLAFLVGGSSPVSQFWTDTGGRGFQVTLSGVSTTGYASFTAFYPDTGKPRFRCTGAAPLCNRGTFRIQARP